MAKKKKGGLFNSLGWKVGMKYLYGWGASVVIVGALFKILHLPGANEMLIVGLGTEAVIFFFSAFEPLPEDETHWEWDRVFPQLNSEDDEVPLAAIGGGGSANAAILAGGLQSTSQLLKDNEIKPELFEQLADSIKGLKVQVENLAEISDTTVATNEFADKLKQASSKIDQLNKGYTSAVESMNQFGKSLDDVKAYQAQIQTVTKNLGSLNSVYENELASAKAHIESVNKFYGSISNVMQNLLDTSKDTDQLRTEVSHLAKNMQSLNHIYGSMLTAMASASNR